jgi:hypothetical protein
MMKLYRLYIAARAGNVAWLCGSYCRSQSLGRLSNFPSMTSARTCIKRIGCGTVVRRYSKEFTLPASARLSLSPPFTFTLVWRPRSILFSYCYAYPSFSTSWALRRQDRDLHIPRQYHKVAGWAGKCYAMRDRFKKVGGVTVNPGPSHACVTMGGWGGLVRMQAHGGPILIIKEIEIRLGYHKTLIPSALLRRLNKVWELHPIIWPSFNNRTISFMKGISNCRLDHCLTVFPHCKKTSIRHENKSWTWNKSVIHDFQGLVEACSASYVLQEVCWSSK